MKPDNTKTRRGDVATIAAEIKSLSTRTLLSQAAIAQHLGVRPKTLSAWLSGLTECRHRKLLELAVEALATRLDKVSVED